MSATAPKRRWYQFTLRGLLVLVTLIAGALGFWVAAIRPYQRINATYLRLRHRDVEIGEIGDVQIRWYQRPFLGSGLYGKCGLLYFRGEPTAGDFDDLRSVINDEIAIYIACPLSDETVKQLATLNISTLRLEAEGNLTHDGWRMLRGKQLPKLVVHSWFNAVNKFSDSDLGVVSEFRGLESLAFDAWNLTDRDFKFLKPMVELKEFFVHASITDESLTFLAGAELKTLTIEGSSETPPTGAGLADIGDVESLTLKSDALTDESLARIARWPSLRDLQITFSKKITRNGLRNLTDAQRLQSLAAHFAKFDDADLEVLADCKNLKKLSLRGTRATGSVLRSLAHLPLEELDLDGCPLSDDAVDIVANMPGSFVVDVDDRQLKSFRQKLGSRVRCEIMPTW